MPGEFHAAAGMIYRRIADFKDAPSTPALAEVLEALMQTNRDLGTTTAVITHNAAIAGMAPRNVRWHLEVDPIEFD